MKGDFSRFTFRSDRHYNGVRMQQGRVQLDADWNEQVDILAHLRHTEALDVIGATGVPHERGGFEINVAGDDLSILDGRIYVNGILVENEATVLYKQQPYYPVPADVSLDSGLYLVYLDVWQRHITAFELPVPEDRALRDVALGGPDTATRTQVIWQTRLLRVGAADSGINCWDVPTAWTDLVTRQHGRMRAQTKAPETESNPCIVPASAGYQRLENQLYRVEIHNRGTAGTATFKWSRDNGMVVTRLLDMEGKVLSVADAGRDEVLGFARGQWIEISDEARVLRGEPGVLVSIKDVVENTIEIDAWPSSITDPNTNFDLATATVRRWDHVSDIDLASHVATGTVAVVQDSWIDLESGVQISFDGSAEYETGDYWLIPARTVSSESLTGDIEWPRDPNQADQPAWLPPRGIEHHYARLALVTWDGEGYTRKHDCRLLIPALTEPDLYYISGDGQEAMPGDTLPQVLSVGVSNCNRPIEGAWIRFDLHKEGTDGDGTLTVLPGTVATRIHSIDTDGKWLILATDEAGEAACVWQLQSRATLEPAVGDEATTLPAQQVRATLLLNPTDHDQDKLDRPVVFSASFGVAWENQYAGSDFPDQQHTSLKVETVEDALDQLRQNVALAYVSGDGQEAKRLYVQNDGSWVRELTPIPQSLVVRAANGDWPFENALVKFKITSGAGSIQPATGYVAINPVTTDDSSRTTEFVVETNAQGLAACLWELDSDAVAQQVTATLENTLPAGTDNFMVFPSDIIFNGNLGIAAEVAFDGSVFPDDTHPVLEVHTVEDALDQLRQNVALYYVGGDGQEAKRNYVPTDGGWEILRGQLPHPLVVRVANGDWPFRQAKVRFLITDGNGSIKPAAGFVPQDQVIEADGRTTQFDILTDTNGLAGCLWEIGEPVNSVVGQQVTATLVETLPAETDNFIVLPGPISFHAFLSLANEVSYDGSAFPDSAHQSLEVHTVEDALDQLRENTALHYVSGDGQEIYPGEELAAALQVRVANGQWPRAGAEVRFEVLTDGEGGSHGTLTVGSGTGSSVLAITDENGVAECYWTPNADGPTSQQVVAHMNSSLQVSDELSGVVRFNAQLRKAEDIYYAHNDESLEESPPESVQGAIDELYGMKVNRAGDIMTGDLGINANLAVEQNVSIGYYSDLNVDGRFTDETEGYAVVRINGGVHVGGDTDPGNDNLEVDGDLNVHGNLLVQGETVLVNTDKMQGNVVLGDEDADTITVEGRIVTGHSSGALQIKSPLAVSGAAAFANNVAVGGVLQGTGIVGTQQIADGAVTAAKLSSSVALGSADLSRIHRVPLLQQTLFKRPFATVTGMTSPLGVTFDGIFLWVLNWNANSVSKIDINTNTVVATVTGLSTPRGIAFDGAYIWVGNQGTNSVNKIDINTHTVVATVPVTTPYGAAFDGIYLWVAGPNTASKIDISTNSVVATVPLPGVTYPYMLAFDGAYLWVGAYVGTTVSKIDVNANAVVATVGGLYYPFGLAFDGTYLWVANASANNLKKIDVNTNIVVATVELSGAFGLGFDGTGLWVGTTAGIVKKIDVNTHAVLATMQIGGNLYSMGFDGEAMWVANYGGTTVSKIRKII